MWDTALEAAIAALADAQIRKSEKSVDSFTYGQPRIGSKPVNNFITNQNRGGNYRFTHIDDRISRSPLTFQGYAHISPEYWITSGKNVNPTPNDNPEAGRRQKSQRK